MTPTQTRAMVWNTYRFAAGMGTGVAEDDAFAAALAAHEAALTPQWQDIETGPKDGTSVLLVGRNGGMTVAAWCRSLQSWQIDDTGDGYPESGRAEGYTHWMSLPTPPVVTP
jgi:hypothetical protein